MFVDVVGAGPRTVDARRLTPWSLNHDAGQLAVPWGDYRAVTGEGGSVDDRTVEEVIQGLRSLLEAIEAGRVEASVAQHAYLSSAVDTLNAISKRSQ